MNKKSIQLNIAGFTAEEQVRIEAALAESGGNKSRAAQLLGLTLRQFNYRISRLGRPTK